MTSMDKRAPDIRRVVTGHNEQGQSTISIDAPATNHRFPAEFVTSTTLWSTDSMPVQFLLQEDYGARKLGTAAPPNGTRFTWLELKPGYNPPGMHRTDSLDCTVVLAGHPTLIMDDGSRVTLNPQDVVVHRGTNHSWVNDGDEIVKMFGVLVDGTPKREGSLSGTKLADT